MKLLPPPPGVGETAHPQFLTGWLQSSPRGASFSLSRVKARILQREATPTGAHTETHARLQSSPPGASFSLSHVPSLPRLHRHSLDSAGRTSTRGHDILACKTRPARPSSHSSVWEEVGRAGVRGVVWSQSFSSVQEVGVVKPSWTPRLPQDKCHISGAPRTHELCTSLRRRSPMGAMDFLGHASPPGHARCPARVLSAAPWRAVSHEPGAMHSLPECKRSRSQRRRLLPVLLWLCGCGYI
jgi:hypothetical protein